MHVITLAAVPRRTDRSFIPSRVAPHARSRDSRFWLL